MAEYLNMAGRAQEVKRVIRLAVMSCVTIMGLLMGLSTAWPVRAESLTDPTQPPAAITGGGVAAEADTGPVLQSVMLGPKYHAAIISGQRVLLGKKYGEATLIRLSDREAVLRYPDRTTKTLVMDYAIEKKLVLPRGGKQSR